MAAHLQTCPGATTAFVFSCPGQKEEHLGYPCAGATGRNLKEALPHLQALLPQCFASGNRCDYVITNSWSGVEYPAKTGRSEASLTQVLSPSNVQRLAGELQGIQTIVIAGQKAKHAVLALQGSGQLPGVRIAIALHLSPLAINTQREWLGKTPSERMRLWAQDVVRQLLA
jgi:hypothetical protein